MEYNISNRIDTLLKKEQNKRDIFSYYLSLLEEIGELANAIKQEEGIVEHKTLNESSLSECADVIICAFMMLALNIDDKTYKIEDLNDVEKKFIDGYDSLILTVNEIDKSKNATSQYLMYTISLSCPFCIGENAIENCIQVLLKTSILYANRGGRKEDLFENINKKLDKWEVNLSKRLGEK